MKQYDNLGDMVVSSIFGFINGSKHATQEGASSHNKNVNPEGGHSIVDFLSIIDGLEEGNYQFINGEFKQ